MNPADLLLLIQGIEAAIAAAPKVIAVAEKGKALITSLFEAGAISIETQNATHAHIDAVQAAVQAGTVPPAWTVEADPGSLTNTAPVTSSAPAVTSEAPPAPEASAPQFGAIPPESQSAETVAEEKAATEAPKTE